MSNSSSPIRGRFQAIDSFAIRQRGEFYIIGHVAEGEVQEQWFACVSLNSSLTVTLRIAQIETIVMSGSSEECQLLIVSGTSDDIDFLLGLNIGAEPISISVEGAD